VPSVVATAEKMFENSDAQVRAETEKAFNLSFLEMIGNIRFLFGAIGLAVVISIFFITANTMAMAARERTGEMAVLKTLGFSGGQVLTLVVLESLAVGVFGALLGCALAFALVGGLAKAAESVFPVFSTIAVTPKVWGIGLGVGLAIGLLSGLFPAIAASRMRIADALRRI
jgi:putative ABC transport system permease protein